MRVPRPLAVVVGVVVLVALAVWLRAATTFTVDSAADTPDDTPGDCLCDDGAGACTLRAALEEANACAGDDTINFSGALTITPATDLPAIASNVVIEDTGATCADLLAGTMHTLRVVIDGPGDGLSYGLQVDSGTVTIRGLEITGFTGTVPGVDPAINVAGGTVTVQCTYLHGNAEGLGTAADSTMIGGATTGDGNVIVDSVVDGVFITSADVEVFGNLIGILADGTCASNEDGVYLQGAGATGAIIGSSVGAGRNIISCNNHVGVSLDVGAHTNTVVNNLIGTDRLGVTAKPNGGGGVLVTGGGDDNMIGGASAADRNIISANGGFGVRIEDATSSGTTIANNYIGVAADGTTNLCNAYQNVEDNGTGTTLSDNVIGCNTASCCSLPGDSVNPFPGMTCLDQVAANTYFTSLADCTTFLAAVGYDGGAASNFNATVECDPEGDLVGTCAAANTSAVPPGSRNACCCCGGRSSGGGGAATNTPTATPTPTPTFTPSTPGSVVECVFIDTEDSTQTGSGSSWDLSGSLEPYDTVFLDYDGASGLTALLRLHNLVSAIPTNATILGIALSQPGNALPNDLTTPFLPTDHECDSWGTEPRNTRAQLSDENAAPVGTDKSTNDNITDSPAQLFGDASTDLWGTTWTPAQLNDPNFGIFLEYDFTTSTADHEADCDIYHIVVGNNPDFYPQIAANAATFHICYERPPFTPGPSPTPTHTPVATATASPTATEPAAPNETRYNSGSCSQTANGGTLAWTIGSVCASTRIFIATSGTTFLLQVPLVISTVPPFDVAPGAGATIVGIEVTGAWSNSGLDTSSELVVQLFDSTTTLVGDNKADLGAVGNGNQTYGGAADTWSTGWVGADIAGTWGYGIQASGTESAASVLGFTPVSVSVYWTP